MPGHADDALTLYLGYGRTHAGKVGHGRRLQREQTAAVVGPVDTHAGSKSRRLEQTHTIACVQAHHSMEGRDIVRSGTLAEYRKDAFFAQSDEHVGAGGQIKQEEGRRRVATPEPVSQQTPL